MKTFYCDNCKQTKENHSKFSPGYGTKEGKKHCFDCCAILDKKQMEDTGKIALYFCDNSILKNWPGTLIIYVDSVSLGRHNIAGTRYDVWFKHNGKQWHGVQYGENTQLCHCKQLKSNSS